MLRYALGLASLAALAGCSVAAPAPMGDWVLTELDGVGPAAGVRPITLKVEPNQVYGTAGCSGYGAVYDAWDDRLAFGEITVTRSACAAGPELLAGERTYLQLLAGRLSYHVDRLGRLVLETGEGHRLVYRRR
jgi:heat shock protein HslJ